MAKGKILFQGEWAKLDEQNSNYRGALLTVCGGQCTVTDYPTVAELSEAYQQSISDSAVTHYSVL